MPTKSEDNNARPPGRRGPQARYGMSRPDWLARFGAHAILQGRRP